MERLDFRDKEPEVIDLAPEGGVVKALKESMIDCVVSEKVSPSGCTCSPERLVSRSSTDHAAGPVSLLLPPQVSWTVPSICWVDRRYPASTATV